MNKKLLFVFLYLILNPSIYGNDILPDKFLCSQTKGCYIGDIRIGANRSVIQAYADKNEIPYEYPYPKNGNAAADGSADDVSTILAMTDGIFIVSFFNGIAYAINLDNNIISGTYGNDIDKISNIIYKQNLISVNYSSSKEKIKNNKIIILNKIKNIKIIEYLNSIFGMPSVDFSFWEEVEVSLLWKNENYEILLSPEFGQLVVDRLDIKNLAEKKAEQQQQIKETDNIKLNVTENRVAFRSQANLSSKVLMRLEKGTVVTKSKSTPNFTFQGEGWPIVINDWAAYWFKVKMANGQEGWIYGWFLEPVE